MTAAFGLAYDRHMLRGGRRKMMMLLLRHAFAIILAEYGDTYHIDGAHTCDAIPVINAGDLFLFK